MIILLGQIESDDPLSVGLGFCPLRFDLSLDVELVGKTESSTSIVPVTLLDISPNEDVPSSDKTGVSVEAMITDICIFWVGRASASSLPGVASWKGFVAVAATESPGTPKLDKMAFSALMKL